MPNCIPFLCDSICVVFSLYHSRFKNTTARKNFIPKYALKKISESVRDIIVIFLIIVYNGNIFVMRGKLCPNWF